jgi:hypothetical protein
MNSQLILGDCVHVAGVVNFLNLAEQLGYDTVCLGPAVGVDELLDKIAIHDPAVVAVGYRLTPENCRALLEEPSPHSQRIGADQTKSKSAINRPIRVIRILF